MAGLGRDINAVEGKMQICHVIKEKGRSEDRPFLRQSPTTGINQSLGTGIAS